MYIQTLEQVCCVLLYSRGQASRVETRSSLSAASSRVQDKLDDVKCQHKTVACYSINKQIACDRKYTYSLQYTWYLFDENTTICMLLRDIKPSKTSLANQWRKQVENLNVSFREGFIEKIFPLGGGLPFWHFFPLSKTNIKTCPESSKNAKKFFLCLVTRPPSRLLLSLPPFF